MLDLAPRNVVVALFAAIVPTALAGCGGGEAAKGSSAPATETGAKAVATVHAIEQAFEANDVKAYGALFTDDVALNVAGRPDVRGRPALEAGFQRLHTLFGKVRLRARRIFLKGDIAVVEMITTGTHEGLLDGIAPTHKPVGWMGAEVDRFAPDGRIKERRVYFDGATAVAQAKGAGRPIPEEAPLVVVDGTRTGDTNATILDHMDRAWEQHEEAKWTALLTDDVEWDDLASPKPVRGRANLKGQWSGAAIRDATTSAITTWPVGSFVIDESSLSGLQNGRLVALYQLRIAEVNDGKITRGWTYVNGLDLQAQLGASK